MESCINKGDLVKLKTHRKDSVFLVYSDLGEFVKLYDCCSNVFYPVDPRMYVKKNSLILISEGEVN